MNAYHSVATAKRGFFATYILPVMFLSLLVVAFGLTVVVVHQMQDQQAEKARQAVSISQPRPLLGAYNLPLDATNEIEEVKRILTLRQTVHNSMCHVFTTHHLNTNMQGLLDMDYYLTTSQKRGAELGSKSGLVATRAILESLAVDWPLGARPTTLEETISGIQTYTVVYTIYWQAAEGTATGFYQFEHRLNLQTRDTLSVRLLQTGDVGS